MADTFDPADFAAYKQSAAPTQFDSKDFEQYKTNQPSIAADVAKSAGSGIATGLAGAASVTPGIIGLAAQGAMKLNQALGDPLSYISPGGTGLQQAEANRQAIAQATGPKSYDYAPQTTAGQFFKTGGEFLGGAAAGGGITGGTPGQIGKQLVAQVAAPAIASETAGQAFQGTAAEPYARIGAGLAAGAVGGALTGGAFGAQVTRQEVKANASKLYKMPEVQAAQFTPQSVNTLADTIETNLKRGLFSSDNASAAFNAVDRLREIAKQPSITVGDVRGVRDALSNAVGQGAAAKITARQNIGDFLNNLSPADLATGDANKVSQILRAANKDWAAQATAFELPKVMASAQRYAKQNQIPLEEALAARGRGLLPQERTAAAAAIEGGPVRQALQFVGRFDPTKNPLALMMHVGGGILTGGTSLPYSGTAAVAGRLADYLGRRQAANLRQDILNRSALAQTPAYQPQTPYFPGMAIQPSAAPGAIPRAVVGGLRGGAIAGLPYWLQQ